MATKSREPTTLASFAPWFYAAAAYNFAWGALVIIWPSLLFDLLGVETPNYLPIWQVVGMFVLVFAPAYWWAARFPDRYQLFIVVGMLGKLMGPAGFLWAVAFSDFPVEFGVTIITNDLIWYPAFLLYLTRAARLRGGWGRMLAGE
jgi:hypothetical protein